MHGTTALPGYCASPPPAPDSMKLSFGILISWCLQGRESLIKKILAFILVYFVYCNFFVVLANKANNFKKSINLAFVSTLIWFGFEILLTSLETWSSFRSRLPIIWGPSSSQTLDIFNEKKKSIIFFYQMGFINVGSLGPIFKASDLFFLDLIRSQKTVFVVFAYSTWNCEMSSVR